MGITGLIPFLEKASRVVHIRELAGSTVAIDTYCWLHKGVVGCAEKLLRGEPTDVYVQYCMRQLEILIAYDIKPILVFDGRHLPAKQNVEDERRSSRKEAKEKVKQLLAAGKINEARPLMQRAVDVTHEMAFEVIKACRQRNIDCVVAPYEADGQLAFLSLNDIVDFVITEDSDLVLFGCKKILFKFTGSEGLLVESNKLHLAMGCPPNKFTFDKFRWMCILSGCDYLKSLNGIGLAKAKKFFMLTEETDMRRALGKIPSYLNMRNLVITEEYKEGFLRAEATFKHMVVYNPLKRSLTRLTPVDETINDKLLMNAGEFFDSDTAFQLALGNINPRSMKQIDNWHPDYSKIKVNSKLKTASHTSIWKSDGIQTNYTPQTNFKKNQGCDNDDNEISAIQRITAKYSQKVEESEIARLEESIIESYANESPIRSPQPKRKKIEIEQSEETPKKENNPGKNPFKADFKSPKPTPTANYQLTELNDKNERVTSGLFNSAEKFEGPNATINAKAMEELRQRLHLTEKMRKNSPKAKLKKNIMGTLNENQENDAHNSSDNTSLMEIDSSDNNNTDDRSKKIKKEDLTVIDSPQNENLNVSTVSATYSGESMTDSMLGRLEPNIVLEEEKDEIVLKYDDKEEKPTSSQSKPIKARLSARASGLLKNIKKPSNQQTLSAFGFTSLRK